MVQSQLPHRTLILLDRDGVINYDSDDYIKSPEEWIPLPGSLEAISLLCARGYKVAVVSNQAGVKKGKLSAENLQKITEKMKESVREKQGDLHQIYYCLHLPEENCLCRKPQPGMLLAAAEYFRLPLEQAFFVGDRDSDVQAAQASGAQAVLVKTGKGARDLAKFPEKFKNVPVYADLAEFVRELTSKE